MNATAGEVRFRRVIEPPSEPVIATASQAWIRAYLVGDYQIRPERREDTEKDTTHQCHDHPSGSHIGYLYQLKSLQCMRHRMCPIAAIEREIERHHR